MTASDTREKTAAALFRYLMDRSHIPTQDAAQLLASAIELMPSRRNGFRAAFLHQTFADAAKAAKACGWTGVVVLKDGEVLVDQDGALMRSDMDSRMFRKGGGPPGRDMLGRLRAWGIEPRTILDVGANIGEICIYLAVQLPKARVIAFEPGADNLAALRRNIAQQTSPPANLEVIPEAVSDRSGTIDFTVGAGDLSTVLVEQHADRLARRKRDVRIMSVPTDTLENYCARLGVEEIDFLKVDIEGGEPLLAPSIRAMAGRIRAAVVEMSTFNTLDAYGELIDAFAQAGLAMLHKAKPPKATPVEDPRAWLAAQLDGKVTANVWFVRKDHLP